MSNSSDFIIENGVLTKYVGPGGDVIIPEGVTVIGRTAFWNRSATNDEAGCVTGVVLPEGLIVIDSWAFAECGSLKNINIPDSVKRIGYNAFENCRALAGVTIPKGAAEIDRDAFDAGLLVKIPHWAEYSPEALTFSDKIRILTEDAPENVPVKYRRQALLGFVSEKAANDGPERALAYREYAKKNAGKLLSSAFDYPELLQYLCDEKLIKAKDIDAYVAEAEKRGSPELKALLLNYQDKLGGQAVAKAREKKEKAKEDYIDVLAARIAVRDPAKGIEGITFVITGKLVFWKSKDEVRSYLESYGARLGASVNKDTDYLVACDPKSDSEKKQKAEALGAQVIDEQTFNEMIGWHYQNKDLVIIPDWIRSIPAEAFKNNDRLTGVTIPESVTSIGRKAFLSCKSLKSLSIPANVTEIGPEAFSGCSGLMSLSIPEGVKSIEHRTFASCSSLASVTIPESVTKIGWSAFSDCRNLTDVKLPNALTEIGDRAFSCCSRLTGVTIPESVSKIGSGVFKSCEALADSEGFVIVNGTLFDYCGPRGDISIPDRCRAIDESAFICMYGLSGVEIPNSVTTIGKSAFSACASLTHVTIPESVTKISMSIFSDCGSLTRVEIPDTVTSIEKSAFEGCASLTGIMIPERVTEIGSDAFMGCAKLTSVTLPTGLTRIEPETFKGCSSLTNVTIPDGVKMIGYEAFKACGALTDISLPGSLTEIGFDAFTNRAKLRIHAPEGSYAERYAKENKIKFVAEAKE